MSAPTTPAPPGPADGSRFARLAPAFPVEVRPGKESVILPTRLRCADAALLALCLSLSTLEQFHDRQRVASGKSVSVRLEFRGRRVMKNKNDNSYINHKEITTTN